MRLLDRALLALVLLVAFPAHAAPPSGADPALAPWFRGLLQPGTNYMCCGIADCRPTDARVVDGHWQVFHDGEWLPVPDAVILPPQINPTGEPIACIVAGIVRCFVRATGT